MAGFLEVSVDSLASARAAINGGADQLELSSALSIGGITPFPELFRQIRKESNIKIRCVIRPRGGDFLYSNDEIRLMLSQISTFRKLGADGFVFGCLSSDGNLDTKALKALLAAADGAKVTLNRCIDVSRDPTRTYFNAEDLGFDMVLTSGAARTCYWGLETIGALLLLRDLHHGPEVLIGGGLTPNHIQKIRFHYPQAKAFHMSGKKEIESGMVFRRQNVPMGVPGLDEWHINRTDVDTIREAKRIIDGY